MQVKTLLIQIFFNENNIPIVNINFKLLFLVKNDFNAQKIKAYLFVHKYSYFFVTRVSECIILFIIFIYLYICIIQVNLLVANLIYYVTTIEIILH